LTATDEMVFQRHRHYIHQCLCAICTNYQRA